MRTGILFISMAIVFCAPASAYDWSTNLGDGSAENPYQISTPEQLNSIGLDAALWNSNFILLTDLDMSSESLLGYNIIGVSYAEPFKGTFDGQLYTIFNLKITESTRSNVGLFGALGANASVIDLNLVNIEITGKQFVGGLVGNNRNSTIQNCSVQGKVSGWTHTGGLIGLNFFSKVYRCRVNGEVVASNLFTGGLSGNNQAGEIVKCSFVGSVSGGRSVGALVGQNIANGLVAECFSIADVRGNNSVGGLLGDCHQSTVTDCFVIGTVYGLYQMTGGFTSYIRESTISHCYSAVIVSGPAFFAGGFTSGAYLNNIDNCFWDNQITAQTYDTHKADLAGVCALTTYDMMMAQTYVDNGWDFKGETVNGTNDIWIDTNDYPRLRWESNTSPIADIRDDVTAYAWVDGFAEVKLDGTGSYDADGDALEYFWINDSGELITTGAEAEAVFGVGTYEVTLIVNDGVEDSEPDTCTVNVIAALEVPAKVLAGAVNPRSQRPEIKARLAFAGTEPPAIDKLCPMRMLIGDQEAEAERQTLQYAPKDRTWYLWGMFDADVFERVPAGRCDITVVCRLKSGQWVYGKDAVKVLPKKSPGKPKSGQKLPPAGRPQEKPSKGR